MIEDVNKKEDVSMDKLYVIGSSRGREYLRIYSELDIESPGNLVISGIQYNVQLDQATVIPGIDNAKRILSEIRENRDTIPMCNHSAVGQLLDTQAGYKLDVDKIHIYELVPKKAL